VLPYVVKPQCAEVAGIHMLPAVRICGFEPKEAGGNGRLSWAAPGPRWRSWAMHRGRRCEPSAVGVVGVRSDGASSCSQRPSVVGSSSLGRR